MPTLTTLADVRALVKTGLSDGELQGILDRVEAELVEIVGLPWAQTPPALTEYSEGRGANLFTRRPFATVTTVKQDGNLVAASSYRVWPQEGRIERIDGLTWNSSADPDWYEPSGLSDLNTFRSQIEVVYVVADDSARWKNVVIDLTRLELEQTVMESESVGGEYSYSAPDWEKKRAAILRRIQFVNV